MRPKFHIRDLYNIALWLGVRRTYGVHSKSNFCDIVGRVQAVARRIQPRIAGYP